jgi:peptidoglycan/xylan/chitin deacetylase (PgdA/CDA1 family)
MNSSSNRLLLSRLVKPFYGGIGHILMFHRVCPVHEMISTPGLTSIEVSAEQLSRILDFFQSRNYRFLSLNQVQENLNGRVRQKFVSITFDDGYLDNLTIAYPILKQRKIPFAIYITNSFPDRTAVLWQYLLNDAVKNQQVIHFDLAGKSYRFDFSDLAQIPKSVASIREIIKDTPLNHLTEVLGVIFKQTIHNPQMMTAETTLSWEQIRDLALDPLVTIGSHTLNHQPLVRLNDQNAFQEIAESKYSLERHLGRRIDHFAYPFGDVSPREAEMVRKLGFKTAVTTHIGNIFMAHSTHLLNLPRLNAVEMKNDRDTEIMLNGLTVMTQNHFARVAKV